MSSTRHLNRERIAAAALAIADAEGFGSVSMRRVAHELRVGTMSLYYYARTKAELIAAMDDVLMAEVVAPSLPRDWRKALTMIALRIRDVFIRHPWTLASMQSAPPGVNAMRHMEQCLRVLSGTGMSAQEHLTLLAVIDDFVFGYALRETAGDPMLMSIWRANSSQRGHSPGWPGPSVRSEFVRCRTDSGSVWRRSSLPWRSERSAHPLAPPSESQKIACHGFL